MNRRIRVNLTRTAAIIFATSVLWLIVALTIIFVLPRFTDTLNYKLYDWKLSLTPNTSSSSDIVHLDVDDKAIGEYGQWPWDRALSAKMVERLSQLGAKLVVFDILYSGEGKSAIGNEAFFKAIKEAGNVVSATGLGISDNQGASLSVEGDKSRADALYERAWPMHATNRAILPKVTSLRNPLLPLVPVILNSAGVGHIRGAPDFDGVHRRLPVLVKLEDRYVPSLSLSALAAYWSLNSKDIVFRNGREILIRRGKENAIIPLDAKGMMLVRWGHAGDNFKHYSAVDLLSDQIDKGREARYKDKIVITGVTASASTDVGTTPLAPHVPLSRIHSFALSTMLSGDFIIPIKSTPYIVCLGVIIAILFSLSTTKVSLRTGISVAAGICAGVFVLSISAFVFWGYDVPVAEFFLLVIPSMAGSVAVRAFSIELKAARTAKALEGYLSPELVPLILTSGGELDLTTKRRELTVVFVDIEGFSTTCETVDVEYINQFLNDFFERMAGAIFLHGGTIDKFLGDGLLAFFGDPITIDNTALAAVKAALEMQEQMKQLNSRWSQSGIQEFEKGLRIRIGINTGPVVVGNIGFSRRLEYTVLGSVVNIASRLQSLAPSGGIIMTSRTYALVKNEIEGQGPEKVRVKGIDRDIETYKIVLASI